MRIPPTFRPSTSPPFTGALDIHLPEGMEPVTQQLLDLPSGLHFRNLMYTLSPGEVLQRVTAPVTALVEGCSDTLEYVDIECSRVGESLRLMR